jgi:hypothetical protein
MGINASAKGKAQRVKTLCSMLSALSAFSLTVNGYDSGLERRYIWFL